jgi:PTS system mannitol-specific IIC component
MSSKGRARVQAFGGFLTAMVIPNMGAFIAWGFITALFIETGWLPNEGFAQLVGPIITYILPSLLAYTGGSLIHGQRGGVAGVIGTIGLIVGAEIPMFLGAMIMGPLSAWIIKKFDNMIKHRIPPGFEMVINNFSLGIIGLILCLLSFEVIGPVIVVLNTGLTVAIQALVNTGILPILAVLNEPAKVLFLNNVIDQGIYYPLGMQQAADLGQSIFFMVASNPGAGLGLLLAFWKFGGSKTVRDSAPGAVIIHFLGGIHEIYFPYVLMKPMTLLAMIAGSASGILTFQIFGAGLVAGPSPGSIFAYLLLTPRGGFVGVIAGVLVAAIVSFLVTSLILTVDRRRHKGADEDEDLESFKSQSAAMKAEGKQVLADSLTGSGEATAPTVTAPIRKVVFACDAGMGSSTMGASIFRKKTTAAGLSEVEVTNTAIERIPDDADVVVVHENLAERTRKARPGVRIVTIQNYLNDPAIAELLASLSPQEEK